MYCSHCGKEIADDARFCSACGSAVVKTAPPVYNHASTDTAPVKKEADTRWPAVIGILGIFYLVFVVLQFICIASFYRSKGIPLGALTTWYIQLFLVSLVPVLFFVHTKKLAFLTAVPMFFLTVIDVADVLSNRILWEIPENVIRIVIPAFVSVILFVLYLIQMIVRPRNSAVSICFLILFIMELIYLGILLAISFVDALRGYPMDPANTFSSVFGLIGLLFSAIAYTIAMFRSRKKIG